MQGFEAIRKYNFVIDSVGSLFSINSVVNTLKSHGVKSSHETIGIYLSYLQAAFLIHECDRYDIRGKQILVGEKKYYLNDLTFKYFLTSSFDMRLNRFLENSVYLHLLRSGYQVFVGGYNSKEIDFVAQKNNSKIYVQVSYLLSDEKVIEREFSNLMLIADNYPKYVVSLDEVSFGNYNGILHVRAWDFIMFQDIFQN